MKERTRHRTLLASSLVLLLLLVACDDSHSCTNVGCASDVAIALSSKSWLPGDYTLRVDYDDVSIACAFTVLERAAITSDDAGSGTELDGGSASATPKGQGHCDQSSGRHVETSLMIGQPVVLRVSDAPASLRVRVALDGAKLHDAQEEPEYAILTPNGPDCAPTCLNAAVGIVLP